MKKLVMCQIAVMIFAILLPSLVLALTPPEPVNRTQVMNKAYRMQIPFTENMGQVGSDEVSFYAKTFGGTLYVGKDGTLTYSFPSGDKGGVVIKEIITDNKITVKGLEPSPTRVNYFRGKNQSKWKTGIPSYNSVSLGEVYKGIELTLKAYGKNVEKLFKVLPSADPGSIKVTLQGAKALQVSDQGELEVLTDHGPITFTKPVAYQEVDGKRIEVEVRYKIEGSGGSNQEPEVSLHDSTDSAPNALPVTPMLQLASYGFKIGDYNKSFPLIIDPLLASTFLGGSGVENSNSLTLDRRGNVYVTGWTESSDFPTTAGTHDENYSGGARDVFVSKLNSSLSTLVASTYLGGSGWDEGNSITLDGSGNVYVTGRTVSSDFPTTAGVYDESYNGPSGYSGDVFVSKLDSSLSTLVASTFLGGSNVDYGQSLILDGSKNVYVTGFTDSPDFPTTPGAYDESLTSVRDVFVSKLDSNLSTLEASTYLGGSGDDYGSCLTLDGRGNVYVTGGVGPGFPTTPGAYDESFNSNSSINEDVFVSKLDSSLSTLVASTFLGGTGIDNAYSLTLDGSGNVYVTGLAYSGFPTTPGAYDESHNSNYQCDGFVSKLDSSLSILIASTFLGGTDIDYGQSLALDGSGNVYVTGSTTSPDYPTTPGAYDESRNSYEDVFVSKLDSSLSTLVASTFLGGSDDNNYGQSLALDRRGNVYVTGYAGSGFPTTPGAYDESSNGQYDVFVSKLDSSLLANPQGCLVQMIFGQDSKEVAILRNFRDETLNKTSEGQELIKLYYLWSPVLVKAMEGDEEFRQEVKVMIDSVLPMIGKDILAQ